MCERDPSGPDLPTITSARTKRTTFSVLNKPVRVKGHQAFDKILPKSTGTHLPRFKRLLNCDSTARVEASSLKENRVNIIASVSM